MLTEESPRTFTVVDEITEWTPEHYRQSASMMAHGPNPLPLKLWTVYAHDLHGNLNAVAVVCAADQDHVQALLFGDVNHWLADYEGRELDEFTIEELIAGKTPGIILVGQEPE